MRSNHGLRSLDNSPSCDIAELFGRLSSAGVSPGLTKAERSSTAATENAWARREVEKWKVDRIEANLLLFYFRRVQ